MAKLKKADLEKLLQVEGDEVELDGVFTQDDVNRIITERLAKEKPKLESTQEELDRIKAEYLQTKQAFDSFKTEKDNKGKSEIELLQKQLEEREGKIKAWMEKAEKIEQEKQTAYSRLKQDYATRRLQEVLLGKKAAPERVRQAELVLRSELGDALTVEDQEGRLSLKAIDPKLGIDKDVEKIAEEWLANNTHFAAPSPNGSGLPGSREGAPKDKIDITKMDPLRAIDYAEKQQE